MDPETRKQWELHDDTTEVPKWESMEKFLITRCRALESEPISKDTVQKPAVKKSPPQQVYQASTSKPVCEFCNQAHRVSACQKFKTHNNKYEFVKTKKLCFNCLSSDHGIRNCPSNNSCRECGQKHHTLIHKPKAVQATVSETQSANDVTVATHSAAQSGTVILPTAVVRIRDGHGSTLNVRALLDTGSQASFITESVVQRYNLKKKKISTTVSGLGKSSKTAASSVELSLMCDNTKVATVNAIVMPKLTTDLPSCAIDLTKIKCLQNLKLADAEFHVPSAIDMILGSDVYDDLVMETKFKEGSLCFRQSGSYLAQYSTNIKSESVSICA